jgi:DNA helicase IV
MTQQHPDLAAEQAYIDHAYDCLERSRTDAWKLRDLTEAGIGVGGTFQARYERDVFDEALVNRLSQLDLGGAALVFGRIDRHAEGPEAIETFHIGRLAIADEHRDPVVIDWRAPVAEPFYRATGREPMGLARRRHFAVKGRRLLGLEDELFGEGHLGIGHDEGLDGSGGVTQVSASHGLQGYSTLLESLERGRTGQLGDIVATIQAEQDEIIRSSQAGVLVVQGGPGTGKTVVALHRAAYLLYTYRFPLEDQGVLVIGPNRVFLRYIEQVLPSLGEAGVEQVVLSDLVDDVDVSGTERPFTARVKGDIRMGGVIEKAVRDRERALREDLVVPFGATYLRMSAAESGRIVKAARRRGRRHNAMRKFVETEVWQALAASSRDEVTADQVREAVRHLDAVRAAFERMWPVLTPAELLHDLFGSMGLIRLAAGDILADDESSALYRPRSPDVREARWSAADIALLDDAREVLGPKLAKNGKVDETHEIRTYGHIVIDEVQDLTPMQLKMAARRSLNGSMTIVGDLAQATGPLAPSSWDEVLAHLPDKRESRVVGLSIGYRIPAQIMELATKVMMAATPDLRSPTSVRGGDAPPVISAVDSSDQLGRAAAAAVTQLSGEIGDGSIAVIVPDELVESVSAALSDAGVEHGRATRGGIGNDVTVVPVSVIKGLELDAVVVVEPARIVAAEAQGLRALYVALTRATKRLVVVHAEALPDAMR